MFQTGLALFVFAAAASCSYAAEEPGLLHPKSLDGAPAPATAAEMRALVRNPPAEYRSMPLWVWNDLMEESRIREQLTQMRDQGMGGVFIHPRPGLMTEYLGAEWMRLWKFAMEEGKRLGLIVNIYDENSYPSGFAGGHVPAEVPDSAAQYVQPVPVAESALAQRRGTTVAVFAVKKDAAGKVVAARHVTVPGQMQPGESLLAFRLRRASGNPWTGEFPYVDLTNPATAPAFLESTYEAYKRAVGGEFGRTVKWAFSDEPLLATGGAYDNAPDALPLSYRTLAEFEKRNGYDLAGLIASLYWDVGDFRKVRFDYWQTLHDLWKEHFMRPMFEWTDRNGLQFTGHWMEHEWPYPFISPDDASLYAFEHVPGIDMLEGSNIRRTGQDPHMLFTIKQVASVANQLGRRAFCEAYGVSGWDSTLEHYKRFGDWLMVHGINFIDQHLAFTTIRGARKRDHPQSFSDVAAWWPYYRIHADHLGAVSAASSRSESRNRLLVLEQTTSGFLVARRAGATPELEAMRKNNAALDQFLSDHQVDYDLGDEYMLEWFGKVDGKRLAIARRAYDLVVWPPDMSNMRAQTLPLLEQYLAAGGEVIALAEPAAYVNGRASAKPAELARRYASQWHRVATHEELLAAVKARLSPRIVFDRAMPAGVGLLERWLVDGSCVLFLANTGLEPVEARAIIEGQGIERLDTAPADAAMEYRAAGNGRIEFAVKLAPAGSMLLLVSNDANPAPPAPAGRWTTLAGSVWQAARTAPNVLPLDYCDLVVGQESFRDRNTWEANWMVWQRHGFERPAWDNAVQYRTRVFDQNHFAPESGFTATFHFNLATVPAALALAVESPELYRVSVNGAAVLFGDATYLDPHIRTASLEGLVHAGENTVTLEAHPFDVRMELENVYLLGDFGVEPGDKGFRITAPGPLGLGSWRGQGLPLYGAAVRYQTEVTVPEGDTRLAVELPQWQGSVARVLIDGQDRASIAWQPWRAEIALPRAGRHTVAVEVVATPRNTLGPFHNPAKPRMRAWPAAWAEYPEHQPRGADYDVLDYGLMAAPILSSTHD